MSQRTADPCPHDLRPGLTVCLHCRRTAREAKSARFRRILFNISFAIVGFALCVGIGYFGANSLESGGAVRQVLASAADLVSRAQAAVPRPSRKAPPVTPAPASAPVVQQPVVLQPQLVALITVDSATSNGAAPATDSAATMMTTQDLPLTTSPGDSPAPPPITTAVPATLAPVVAIAAPPPARYAPTLPQGRTELGGDGLYAVRDGEVVRVHFDTELGRTRRAAKFEQIVRATLPRILGLAADSLLRQLPAGRIAASGDLITDLPHRGVELRHIDGRTLTVWPEVRPGRDGPLVVSYRVTTTN
jgi:hypothetical protein